MRRSTFSSFWLLTILALAAIGCGAKKKTPVNPVSGTVMIGKDPVAGADVYFHPVNGPKPPEIPMFPNGRTDDQGRFTLSTHELGDGAPAGSYKVLIHWPKQNGERNEDRDDDPKADRLGGRYATAEKTPLTAEVVAGSNEPKTFEVK
jgi:hypothetical protein